MLWWSVTKRSVCAAHQSCSLFLGMRDSNGTRFLFWDKMFSMKALVIWSGYTISSSADVETELVSTCKTSATASNAWGRKDLVDKYVEYYILLCVNICNVCPSAFALRRTMTVLLNVFWHEWVNTCKSIEHDEEKSGDDYNCIGSGGLAQYAIKKSAATCVCLLTCSQQAAESHLLALIPAFSHFSGFTMQIFLK